MFKRILCAVVLAMVLAGFAGCNQSEGTCHQQIQTEKHVVSQDTIVE